MAHSIALDFLTPTETDRAQAQLGSVPVRRREKDRHDIAAATNLALSYAVSSLTPCPLIAPGILSLAI